MASGNEGIPAAIIQAAALPDYDMYRRRLAVFDHSRWLAARTTRYLKKSYA